MTNNLNLEQPFVFLEGDTMLIILLYEYQYLIVQKQKLNNLILKLSLRTTRSLTPRTSHNLIFLEYRTELLHVCNLRAKFLMKKKLDLL